MKYCSKCGSANTDDAAFCAQCGTGMEQAPKAAEAPVEPTPATFYSAPAAPEAPDQAPASSYNTNAGTYFTSPAPAASPAQSGPVTSAAPAKNPNTLWLILNIVATLCCCLPVGVAGIVFAAMGTSSYNKGDYDDSDKKAKIAMYLFIGGAVAGLILNIVLFATGVLGGALSEFSNY